MVNGYVIAHTGPRPQGIGKRYFLVTFPTVNGKTNPRVVRHKHSGIWQVVFSSKNAKGQVAGSSSNSLGTTDEKTARAAANRWYQLELEAEKASVPVNTKTINELTEEYRQHHLRPDQRIGFAGMLPIIGHMLPIEINDHVQRAIYEARKHIAKSPVSRARELSMLKAMLNWSIRQGHMTADQMPKLVLPPGHKRVRTNTITREQGDQAWEAALTWPNRGVALFFHIAYETGARAKAILQLTWDRISWEAREINFKIPGHEPKNKHYPDAFPITDRLYPVLRDHWQAAGCPQGRVRLINRVGPIYRPFTYFMRSVGIPEGHCSPHVLRHSMVSRKAQDGFTADEIGRLVCDTPEVIFKHYIQFGKEHMRDVANGVLRRGKASP